MRRWIIRLAFLGVALAAAAFLMLTFGLNRAVKEGIERGGSKAAQAPITVGRVSISPFSGEGRIEDLVVGNLEGFSNPSAFQSGSIRLRWKPSSLLSDPIAIRSVEVDAPEIFCEAGLGGNNLNRIAENVTAYIEQSRLLDEFTRKLAIEEFVIRGGQLTLQLKGISILKTKVSLPEIRLENLGGDKGGITPAELTLKVLGALLEKVGAAAGENLSRLGGSGSSTPPRDRRPDAAGESGPR